MIGATVHFDVVCPWCLLGLASWDVALDDVSLPAFEWRMSSFTLRDGLPNEGVPVGEHLARMGYDAAARAVIWDRQRGIGRSLGLDLRVGDAHRLVPSTPGHMGVQAAAEQGRGRDMARAVLSANFVDGRAVGRPEIIEDIAVEIGLELAGYREALRSGRPRSHTREQDIEARRSGVTGVPAVDIAGVGRIAGYRSPDVLRAVLLSSRASMPQRPGQRRL